jgi:hypothetical protein
VSAVSRSCMRIQFGGERSWKSFSLTRWTGNSFQDVPGSNTIALSRMTETRDDDETSVGWPLGKHRHGRSNRRRGGSIRTTLDKSGGRRWNWLKDWQRWIFGFYHHNVSLKVSLFFSIFKNCLISICTCLLWVGCHGIVFLNIYFDSEGKREHYIGQCFCIED